MGRERSQADLTFPMKGMNLVSMRNMQPEGTCINALNVRPIDMIEGRARGGSRPGLEKYCANAHASGDRIQDLNYVTTVLNTLNTSSINRRTILPVMVCNGVISTFTATVVTNATTSGTYALGNATQSPFAFSTELFQRLYYCDGLAYKIFVGANTTTIDWVPAAGALPGDQVNSKVCRLIETWRGRIVLSGLASDPSNWFMSKLGSPLDWDYAPAIPTELDAAQGGVGLIGKVPDVITSIVPYTDDTLLFGCDHSIWLLSGDPMAQGRFDLITDTVGMAFGRAYTQLPDGTLIFFSSSGSIYQMPAGGGKPVSITKTNIDPEIVNTNLNTNIIRMAYDEQAHGVHVFIKPLAVNTNTTHWYYDIRNQGWFKVQFALNAQDPAAIMMYDGDAPGDRVMLIGGQDGYVRKYQANAYLDDGTGFTSYVIMGPIVADKGRYPCILTDLQFIMDDTSGTTMYELGVGDTAEGAIADFASTFTGEVTTDNTTISIGTGRSINYNPRTRGYFQYFKIGTTNPTAAWAIEYIQASYSIVKTSRGRVSLVGTDAWLGVTEGYLLNTTGLWAAWRAEPRFVTYNTTTNAVSSWAPFQSPLNTNTVFANGNATSHPFFVSSSTILNSKPAIAFGTTGCTAVKWLSGTIVDGATNLDVDNGFVSIVCFANASAVNGTGIGAGLVSFENTTGNVFMSATLGNTGKEIHDGSSLSGPEAATSITANTAYILTFAKNSGTGTKLIRRNGTKVTADYTPDSFWWDDVDVGSGGLMRIGKRSASPSPYWNFVTIAEIALYNAYSASVITSVETSLASWYGITLA